MTRIRITFLFFALSLLFSFLACYGSWAFFRPSSYSYSEFQGQVVDADTGEPIAGAFILAQWILTEEWTGHQWKPLQVLDTTSDKKGNFVIPAWGPIRRPSGYYMEDMRPLVLAFKSGYRRGFLLKESTIFLKKFSGTDEEWVDELWWVQKAAKGLIDVRFKGSCQRFYNVLLLEESKIRKNFEKRQEFFKFIRFLLEAPECGK